MGNGVVVLKNRYKEMLMVGLFTAFMGQVNFYPFGTDFRITVGVVVFTFLLLYFYSLPIIATSIVTGISVLLVRVGIDFFAYAIIHHPAGAGHGTGLPKRVYRLQCRYHHHLPGPETGPSH